MVRSPKKMQSHDFRIEVARNNVSGVKYVNKYGLNEDIDTTTAPEDLWDGGGLWVPPTTARVHEITSTDAADTSAGTGARTIQVEGLNADWEEVNEVVTMNGVTPVDTAHSYQRVFRMYVLTSGTGDTNAGNISATAKTDATVTATITAGYGQTFMAVWTVPANHTAYLTQYYGSVVKETAAAGVAEVVVAARYNADSADKTVRYKHFFGLDSDAVSHPEYTFCIPTYYPEKTDLLLRCLAVSANDFTIAGGFTCWYERTRGE